jgi:hypothetical protein
LAAGLLHFAQSAAVVIWHLRIWLEGSFVTFTGVQAQTQEMERVADIVLFANTLAAKIQFWIESPGEKMPFRTKMLRRMGRLHILMNPKRRYPQYSCKQSTIACSAPRAGPSLLRMRPCVF